jgi:uncharacterized protein YpuA (DUF1002 family)
MKCKIDPTEVVKKIDLNISHIYSHNHMVGMDKIFSNVMHQRKSKQGLHYKTTTRRNITTMKNTMYAKVLKIQGFIDLNCDTCKFQTLKNIHIVGTKNN